MFLAAAMASTAFVALVFIAPSSIHVAKTVAPYLIVDLINLAVTMWGISATFRLRPEASMASTYCVALLVAGQFVTNVGVYRILGTPVREVLTRSGVQADDMVVPQTADAPDKLVRKECTILAQCYLSRRPTASLRLDHEGTFLRPRDSAIYFSEAARPVVTALAGITHPIFWPSLGLRSYLDPGEVIRTLNQAGGSLDDLLHRNTFVQRGDVLNGAAISADPHPRLTSAAIVQDGMRVSYSSAAPVFLNAAVTYDTRWHAYINGRSIDVLRGNLDGLVVGVPAGEHTVEFRYISWTSRFFFWTRYAMLAIALIAVAMLLGRFEKNEQREHQ
jgi:hypothetical protein